MTERFMSFVFVCFVASAFATAVGVLLNVALH